MGDGRAPGKLAPPRLPTRAGLYGYLMNSIPFDTLEAADEFKSAGFTDTQVKTLVKVIRKTADLPDVSTLATKADLATLKVEIANAKLQSITIILSGMAVLLTIMAAFLKLVH